MQQHASKTKNTTTKPETQQRIQKHGSKTKAQQEIHNTTAHWKTRQQIHKLKKHNGNLET